MRNRFELKIKTRWLVGLGFVAGMMLASTPISNLASQLTGHGGTTLPATTPVPTSYPTPASTPTPGHHQHPPTYPTPPSGSAGDGGPTGSGSTGDGGTGNPTPPPSTPPPAPAPPSTAPSGPTSVLFSDDFQHTADGQTSDLGSGTVNQEGVNKFVNLTEARVVISRPGWVVIEANANVRENGSVAGAVGISNGPVSLFCGVESGALVLSKQEPSGYTTLGSAPFGGDVTAWNTVRLAIANGQATCSESGVTVSGGEVPASFHANAAILQSRVHALTFSNDFALLSVSGYNVRPT